jgi:hypothetical protein
VFIARVQRVGGEYFVAIPIDSVIERDLHEGQVVSVLIEAFTDYADVDVTFDEPDASAWRMNEDRPEYPKQEER